MILFEIAKKRAQQVIEAKKKRSPAEVEALAREMTECETQKQNAHDPAFLPFEAALRHRYAEDGIAFICEVKRASPSKGIIVEDFPYLQIAHEYEMAGAAAISCLTEPDWFLGKDEYLRKIADSVQIPVLRKDFTVDEYQIFEAKTLGASAVLLICALLDTEMLRKFIATAHALRLSALVEAHNANEIASALQAEARIIGVNNRDLKTFSVDVSTSIRLRSLVPPECVFVSESGIKTPEQIAELHRNQVHAVLVGESLMRNPDKKNALKSLSNH